jgi:bifunctional non-homologous end joining protein LigD
MDEGFAAARIRCVISVSLPAIEPSDMMHGVRVRAPFSRDGWIFEIKYDGYRAFIRKHDNHVELLSRHGTVMNATFPDIVEAVSAVPGNFIWDGELTVDESNGRSSFEDLQQRARLRIPMRVRAAARERPARLYVFDILGFRDDDLRQLPLDERKEILRDTFDDNSVLIYAGGIIGAGEWVFEQAKKLDLEGMMAKRLDSTYQAGRSRDWQKVKNMAYSRPAALGFGRAS